MDRDFHDDDHDPRPLDAHEAEHVRNDLEDLMAFRQVFEPEGYKGVSMYCSDCAEEHYYGWQMLEENLTALLQSGESPVHEPPYDPRPHEYVEWQYAQGYVDGLFESGMNITPTPLAEAAACPHCGVGMPAEGSTFTFCPACGTHLGGARLAKILLDRGWTADDVRTAMNASLFPPLRSLLPDDEDAAGN